MQPAECIILKHWLLSTFKAEYSCRYGTLILCRCMICGSTDQDLFFKRFMPTWQQLCRMEIGLRLLCVGLYTCGCAPKATVNYHCQLDSGQRSCACSSCPPWGKVSIFNTLTRLHQAFTHCLSRAHTYAWSAYNTQLDAAEVSVHYAQHS